MLFVTFTSHPEIPCARSTIAGPVTSSVAASASVRSMLSVAMSKNTSSISPSPASPYTPFKISTIRRFAPARSCRRPPVACTSPCVLNSAQPATSSTAGMWQS